MNPIERVSLRVCKKLLEKFPFLDKTFLSYSATWLENEQKNIELQIVTKENEYKFVLGLIPNDKDTDGEVNSVFHQYQSPIHIEDENTFVKIKGISIKGYDTVKFEACDLTQLKLILQALAYNHSKNIEESYLSSSYDFVIPTEYDLSDIQDILVIIQAYEPQNGRKIDPVILLKGIEKLVSARKALHEHKEDYLYVKGNIFQKKLFIRNIQNQPKECIILDIESENITHLVYDVLLTIFYFSSQKLRQQQFHELLNYYYDVLKISLSNSSFSFTRVLPLKVFQIQIHTYLPYAKLEMLRQHCQTFLKNYKVSKDSGRENLDLFETKDLIWTSIAEINECILYPRLTREDCYEIIKNKIGSSEYTFLSYKIIQLEERNGFLGDYFKIKINILHDDEDKVLNLFAKYIPDGFELNRELASDSYKKEEFYYRIFIPEIIRLGLEDISDFLPKCYFSRTDDVLIFEDMSLMNFSSVDVNNLFSYDLLQVVIKQLAKMHACSLLYEEIMTKESGKIVRLDSIYEEYVEEAIYQEKNQVKKSLDCGMDTVLKMLDLFPEIPKKITMEEFKRKAGRCYDLAYEKVKKSDRFRNVICQGDCWSSNILLQMNEDNKPLDCVILDYQLTRYCPPAQDLIYLFYMVTNKEMRRKYMAKLIDEYYLELSIILKKYNFDLDTIYTYENFLDSCNYMKSQGACHAALISQFLFYPREKMVTLVGDAEKAAHFFYEDRKELLEEIESNEIYRQRMRDIIEELYDICETDCLEI